VTGEPDDDLQRLLVGRPLFPRVAVSGAIAYLGQMDVPEPAWSRVVAFGTPEEGVIDLLSGAVPYAPPAWSPSGDHLALLRGQASSPVQRLVVYEVDGGGEQELIEREGLRSVEWVSDTELIFTTVSDVVSLDLASGRTREVASHRVAAAFGRFGIDDLYVTIDQVAPSPGGQLAVVLRWCQQGKPCWEEPHVVIEGEFQPAANRSDSGRSPRWSADGRLAVAVSDGIRILGPGGSGVTVPVTGLHSFDWLPPQVSRLTLADVQRDRPRSELHLRGRI
jgi:hypothetical protein